MKFSVRRSALSFGLMLSLFIAVFPSFALAETKSLLSSSFDNGSSSWSITAASCTGITNDLCQARYKTSYEVTGGFAGGFLRSFGISALEGNALSEVGWNSPIFEIPKDREVLSVSGRFLHRSHVIREPFTPSDFGSFYMRNPSALIGVRILLNDLSSGSQRELVVNAPVPANLGAGPWNQVDFSVPAEYFVPGNTYQVVSKAVFIWPSSLRGAVFTVAEDIDNFSLNAEVKQPVVPPVNLPPDPQPPVTAKGPGFSGGSIPSELSDANCRMVSVAGGKRSTRVSGRKVRVLVQGGQPATPARTFNVAVQTSGARLPVSFFLDGKKLAVKRGVLQVKPSILGSRETGNLTVRVGSGKQAKSITIKLRFRPCVRVFWIAKRHKNLRARVVSRVPIQSVIMSLPAQMRLRAGNAGTAVGALKLGTQSVSVTRAQGFAQNGGLLALNTATIKYNKAQNTVSIENFSVLPQTLELELLGKALKVTNSRQRLRATAVVQDQEGKTKLTAVRSK